MSRYREIMKALGEAPSIDHENSEDCLAALAEHLGYKYSCAENVIFTGIPDVVRCKNRNRDLFVGEAKATESPTDTSSIQRLTGYFNSCHDMLQTATIDSFLIAICPSNHDDLAGWRAVLAAIADGYGYEVGDGPKVNLSKLGDCRFAWQIYHL